MKIIESNEDNFTFENAFVSEENGVLSPRAVVGGILCDIETKPTLLASGIAYCCPVLPEQTDNWPLSVTVEKEVNDRETLWNCTANPRIVAAARKFNDLISEGTAQNGMEL